MFKRKKEILLESLVIDNTNEFTPLEKKILKKFFRLYGLEDHFDIYDNAALLIEEMEMDYQSAFDLAYTFFKKREILFSESSFLRSNFEKNKIFFKFLNTGMIKFEKNYDKLSIDEKTITIKIEGDEPLERVIRFWDSYTGFMLYLPLNYTFSNEERDQKSILIYVNFNTKDHPEKKWYNDDENFNVNINYSMGEGNREQKNITNFDYPYPEKIDSESINKTIQNIYDIVKKEIEGFNFSM